MTLPHNQPAARSSGRASLRGAEVLTLQSLTAIVVLQGPLASISRVAGKMLGDSLLSNTFVVDVLSAILVAFALVLSALVATRYDFSTLLGLLIIVGLSLLLLIPAALGGPYQPDSMSWNTRFEEVSRSLAIFAIYAVFFLWRPAPVTSVPKAAVTVAWMTIAGALAMLVLTVLQGLQLVPNLYFQWFGTEHLNRPAGGMAHPHFYACANAITLAAVLFLYRVHRIRFYAAYLVATLMLLGSVLSTSRVGLLFSILAFMIFVFGMHRASVARYLLLAAGTVLAGAILVLILAIVAPEAIARYLDVFFLFLRSDDGALRGRTLLWGIELSFIFRDGYTLLFGYGYQPVVSHNLVLRQLQVGGIVGTIGLVLLLYFIVSRSVNKTPEKFRLCIAIIVMPILIASATLPILVSIFVNVSAVSLLMALMATPASAISK